MLSRRNIRIKLLQVLFALALDKEESLDAEKMYRRRIQNSYQLFVYCLYVLTETARKSLDDKERRKNKHIPKPEDEAFTARIYENEAIQSLGRNTHFLTLCKRYELDRAIDQDLIQGIYQAYSKDEGYLKYATHAEDGADDVEGLLAFFREIKKNDIFEEMMYDYGHSWLDDKSLIIGAIKKVLKLLPSETNFLLSFRPDDETVEDFGMTLLRGVQEREEELKAYILPVLDNWEMERLAILDMIVLKLAVTEMILFEKIPVKASINEYLEIVKQYSTDKSKDFVNGVLDTLMRQLIDKGVIQKAS